MPCETFAQSKLARVARLRSGRGAARGVKKFGEIIAGPEGVADPREDLWQMQTLSVVVHVSYDIMTCLNQIACRHLYRCCMQEYAIMYLKRPVCMEKPSVIISYSRYIARLT